MLTLQKKKKKSGEKVYGIESVTVDIIYVSIPFTGTFITFAVLNDAELILL